MVRRDTARQIASFATIGALCTAAYALLFAVLRARVAPGAANATALLVTTVANTAANRRFTFGVRTAANRARDHLAGLLAFGTSLAITSGAIAALPSRTSRITEALVLVAANLTGTLLRFAILRRVVAHPQERTSTVPAWPIATHRM